MKAYMTETKYLVARLRDGLKHCTGVILEGAANTIEDQIDEIADLCRMNAEATTLAKQLSLQIKQLQGALNKEAKSQHEAGWGGQSLDNRSPTPRKR